MRFGKMDSGRKKIVPWILELDQLEGSRPRYSIPGPELIFKRTLIGPKKRKLSYAPQDHRHNIWHLGSRNLRLEIQRNATLSAMSHVAVGIRRRVRRLLDF